MKFKNLTLIEWLEYEAGYGNRPDGYSIHLDKNHSQKFLDDYWERERKANPSGRVPECYSAPIDSGGKIIVVDKQFYDYVKAREGSCYLWKGDFISVNEPIVHYQLSNEMKKRLIDSGFWEKAKQEKK